MFAISRAIEIGSYEYLFDRVVSSYKQLNDLFVKENVKYASELVSKEFAKEYLSKVIDITNKKNIDLNVFISGTMDYVDKLNDIENPLPLLYYQGNLELLYSPSVAVVGTRKPTETGIKRTKKLVRMLVERNITIVSGLADGVDTAAHIATIENGGNTIGVIGTPITESYPAKNKLLQSKIAEEHLLISQVPIIRYLKGNPNSNRFNFPERNKTMSAVSDATIIVEASNTSGTLTQAKAAIKQGRKLFILNNNFENKELTWPEKFEKQGAIRVFDFEQIIEELQLKTK